MPRKRNHQDDLTIIEPENRIKFVANERTLAAISGGMIPESKSLSSGHILPTKSTTGTG
jgi:hypothetical protein